MFATADLSDDHPEARVLEPVFARYGARRAFSGPVRTVKVHEDNVLVVSALEVVDEGTVLVVDGGGSMSCALIGDRLAQIAVDRRVAGIIVYGSVRDTAQLAEMDVGILALAASPRRSHKRGEGEADVGVHIAGVEIQPGDFVYADADGVLVSAEPLI